MKRIILSWIASLAVFVSYIGIGPTSWSSYHQPQAPEELIK
jgi:cyclic lactone autoinducer peptide